MTEAENLISKGLRAVPYTKGESESERNPHKRGGHNGRQKRK